MMIPLPRYLSLLFVLFAVAPSVAAAPPLTATYDAAASLTAYRQMLREFRAAHGGTRDLPNVAFFQFGMGPRTKYLFKQGRLLRASDGKVIRQWEASQELIVPPDYLVQINQPDGTTVCIREDEQAVWIETDGDRQQLAGTGNPVKLPTFVGHRYAPVLRVLHHEILINIVDGLPVPNHFVYKKPWYRDAALMAMCLQATGNLDAIRNWITNLEQPYDRNNAGETEADNLGEALFLISLASDKHHPLVVKIIDELPRFEVRDGQQLYIRGRSDFAEHPVYQTKWVKYGLRALGLNDPYIIPAVADSYSSLFWMDYRDQHLSGTEATDRNHYPYLGWATDHFQGKHRSPISNRDYPLTWETEASQADYAGMAIVDPVYVERKTSVPHTWHAAEVFLYLLQTASQ